MKVLHVISSGGMYGAEAVILNLSRALNACGHTSIVAVFQNTADPNVKLYEVAKSQGLEAYTILCEGQIDRAVPGRIRDLARQVGADIVHAHGYKADIYVYLARRGLRIPIVSTCHTWYDNNVTLRVYGALDRWVLKSFSGVVAVSEVVKARLLGSGVARERVRLIRNGVDTLPFANARLRRNGQEAEPSLRVGLVGRLAPEKGVDLFIQAAGEVLRVEPNARFFVVGDGPMFAELNALIDERELSGRVSLLGRREDMPEFLASLDLLVSSSRQEGLPIAILEGMACGLAVVATRVGAVPMIVREGETGLLVREEDVEGLASAMTRMLKDEALRGMYGRAGAQRIEAEFSAERMTREYLDFYVQAK